MKKQIILKVLTLFIVLSLTGCGEMIDGAAHVGYGISTFMIGLFKFIGVLLLIVVVVAIIVNIIRALFN
jgi:hypothetical protein